MHRKKQKRHIKDYITEYLDSLNVEKGYSPLTVKSYKRYLSNFVENSKIKDIDQLNKNIVREYLKKLKDSGATQHTIYGQIIALRNFAKYLLLNEYIKNSNLLTLELPKLPKKIPEILTQDEVKRILNASKESARDWAILETLYSTGTRASEICGLKNKDIDLEKGIAKVFGKGDKERLVFLNKHAVKTIKYYQATKTKEELDFNKPLFNLHRASIRAIVNEYAQRVGITKRVYPHLFRHSFATHLYEDGANIREVQEFLGHANISTTQIYTYISLKKIKEDYLKFHPRAGKKPKSLVNFTKNLATPIKTKAEEKKEEERQKRIENLKKELESSREVEVLNRKNPIINYKEASKILGISISHLLKLAKSGIVKGEYERYLGWFFKKNYIEGLAKLAPELIRKRKRK
jgi:integrase/recombinase XerD